jgi:dTDP-D-glucose 4,6-dehydratase
MVMVNTRVIGCLLKTAVAIDLVFHEGVNHDTYNIGGFNEWQNIDLLNCFAKSWMRN